MTGSRFEDRYEILDELGAGSLGRVYRARQLSTGQSVAIKLLAPREGSEESTGRVRFHRETQICAALSHVHIVPLIDAGETKDGQLYAVFAHIPGETLEQALSRETQVDIRECVRLMTQVLDALAAAHAKGIVHRDLKPANLMLSGTGARRNALILDFGLGGIAEGRRRKDWQTLTRTGEFLGTPLYASPEQLAGEAPSARSDLYAWGLIFLECLTGRHPFSEAGAAARLLTGGGAVEIPDWLRGHRLGELLERVTAREAAKRDVSIEALIEALDEIGRGELPVAPEASRAPAPLADQGERRHLTVLFCDLVGSSALAQRLAPEVYRRIVQAYHARAAEAIGRYAGHVAQYLGDGLLVYFGYPQAHEDDAERAVRAGRGILRELQVLNPRLEAEHGERLQVRIGIHTGPVVVGETGGGEERQTLAVGDTVNVAARLEGFAAPDTLVISGATLRLVTGLVVSEDLGTPALKGISEPIRVHRVTQILPRSVTSPRLTPFVGREEELALLFRRWEQAQESRGQAVLIAGEPGIGKSRLTQRLREQLREAEAPHTWLACSCSPYTQNSAFSPVIELVEQGLGFDDELSPDQKLERLERGLALAGLEPAEAVPLLASLLSLRLPERYAPLDMSPQLQRQRTLETLLAWVLALGERQPVVLRVEDLHWADPSTLEWLGTLIEQCATAGVLLLLVFRPEFEVPWPTRSHLVSITLSRLSRGQAKELVAAAVGESLPGEVVDRLAARSDGVPLFVEELAKGVVESGQDLARSASGLEIPETLQDSLMARLDRLGEAKPVAQLGAAIGREFAYALLEAVAPLKPAALREGLGRLVEAELVYQRGLPPKATYTFKHALVQDTAFQSLLESQRREVHGRIADALEQHFPERVAREPEAVARHCDAAGRTSQAIGHYQRAGERAKQASANEEAIGYLERALELLGTLPETRERDRQELALQMAIAGPLGAARGFPHPACRRAFDRARTLTSRIGDVPGRVGVLVGLATSYRDQGDFVAASELANEALQAAERTGGAFDLLSAHYALGAPFLQGELARSLHHLERAVELYDFAEHAPLAHTLGRDLGVHSLAFAAICHVTLGHPDRGLAMSQEAVALAGRVQHSPSLVFALASAGVIHWLRREPLQAEERAEAAFALARERGLPVYLAIARVVRGWARAMTGEGDERLAEVQQVFAAVKRSQLRIALPQFGGAIAEALWKLGRREEAVSALDLGIARAKEVGARWSDAEFHRLRAGILMERGGGPPDEAEDLLRRALAIAREQEAKWWELRAATSLARLHRDQGRRAEAHAVLVPIHDWFREGFDTADLKDARALLDEP